LSLSHISITAETPAESCWCQWEEGWEKIAKPQNS